MWFKWFAGSIKKGHCSPDQLFRRARPLACAVKTATLILAEKKKNIENVDLGYVGR